MMKNIIKLAFIALFFGTPIQLYAGEMHEVSFSSTDGVTLYGDLYLPNDDKAAPLIMLFHQAGGSARGEYASHIKHLEALGYNILAVDLRTGGNFFGVENRTMVANGNKEFGYCDAYPDLEASLDFAKTQGFKGPIMAWGSSFSAALVVKLAALRGDDLAAVLAFSPASGDPVKNCLPSDFINDVNIPAFAARPEREMSFGTVAQDLEAMHDAGFETLVVEGGVHGSSMLNESRTKQNMDETWQKIEQFLERSSAF